MDDFNHQVTMDEAIALNELVHTRYRPLTNYEDVLLMHRHFDLPRPAQPQLLEQGAFEFRKTFLEEELEEFVLAHREGDLEKAADGLIDLVYVVLGTAVFMGLPWQALWNEVQRANMAKERGTNAKRGSYDADLVKPAGWRPPQIGKVLSAWQQTNEGGEQ